VSATTQAQLGSVIWAEVADGNGVRKLRPAVVVSPSADIAAGRPVRVVAITTRLPKPLPADHVLLPWDRQGVARSGLRRKCAAVATWIVEIAGSDVRQIVGLLPPVVISELLDKIVLMALPPAQEAGDALPNDLPHPGDRH
jgi:mRNA-degrading endonuclease toxin of MazEF toxin-antitoxin module